MPPLFLIFKNKETSLLSQEMETLLFDKGILNRYKSIQNYFSRETISFDSKETDRLLKHAEKEIYDQLYFLALLHYHYMNISGDWGQVSEQQIKISFCRILLKIPPNQSLSSADALQFFTRLEQDMVDKNIQHIPADQAKQKIRDCQLTLFHHTFSMHHLQVLNSILRFIGSQWFIQSGAWGNLSEFILGTRKIIHKVGYDIYWIETEILRSPQVIGNMAALIGERAIYLRKESLDTIFFQKWAPVLEFNPSFSLEIDRAISEGIKRHVLHLFNVQNKEALYAIQKKFINDMRETIMYHEIGHGIVSHDILPPEIGAIAKGTRGTGENILSSILEFLADFIPAYSDGKGAIQHIIDISKTDPKRAERMYYMYFSDIWFFDTEDVYMYLYSDLVSLIMIGYVREDLSVNFNALEKAIVYRPERETRSPFSLVEQLVDYLAVYTEKIKHITMSAHFVITGETKHSYTYVKKLTYRNFKAWGKTIDESSPAFLSSYWNCMLTYVKLLSDAWSKIDALINEGEKTILKDVFYACAGEKKAEEYHFDHRRYVRDRCVELGLVMSSKV